MVKPVRGPRRNVWEQEIHMADTRTGQKSETSQKRSKTKQCPLGKKKEKEKLSQIIMQIRSNNGKKGVWVWEDETADPVPLGPDGGHMVWWRQFILRRGSDCSHEDWCVRNPLGGWIQNGHGKIRSG